MLNSLNDGWNMLEYIWFVIFVICEYVEYNIPGLVFYFFCVLSCAGKHEREKKSQINDDITLLREYLSLSLSLYSLALSPSFFFFLSFEKGVKEEKLRYWGRRERERERERKRKWVKWDFETKPLGKEFLKEREREREREADGLKKGEIESFDTKQLVSFSHFIFSLFSCSLSLFLLSLSFLALSLFPSTWG